MAAGQVTAQDRMKVGFLYVGPVGDHGWTYEHNQGRLQVERELGREVETIYREKVPEGDEAIEAMEEMIAEGAELIFTTSFGYMEPTLEMATKHPGIKFEHATGYKRAENVATFSARFYEGRYILGQIAAEVSQAGRAGYIASFPIPEVMRGINAFTLGAHSVDPAFEVEVLWVSTWFEPPKEAEAAYTLVGRGVDILVQHTDSTAALQVAAEQGVWAFGQASDMRNYGPHNQLTAIVDDWGPYYVDRTRKVLNGRWESTDTWDGMKQGMVRMAPYTNMPEDVAKRAQETQDKLEKGEIHAFDGPVFDQQGIERVPKGRRLNDQGLATMDWYVQGVMGKPPA